MKAVLFDNDGVLVDSEPLHRVAWEQVYRPRGVQVSESDYAWSIGRRDITFAGIIGEKAGLPDTAEVLVNEKREHLLRMLAEDSQTFPGLPALVAALAAVCKVGVASSAMRPEVDIVLDRFGLRPHIAAVVSNEDVGRHKPDPEPYLLCAERLGVEPAGCVVIEDSVSGVESARAAGMPVVAFTSTFPAEKLGGADAVVESLTDTTALVELIESLSAGAAQV